MLHSLWGLGQPEARRTLEKGSPVGKGDPEMSQRDKRLKDGKCPKKER